MHRRLIYFAVRCDHISPLIYGRWHREAVTEGLKFIKCRKFTAIGGVPTHRRRQHHTVRLHLISHYVTASPGGEADCSLRPGGEGGATRRMRASLTVSSHQIQRIGGMRHAALRRETKECRTILFAHAKSKFLQKYFNRNKFFFAFFYNVPCPV